MKMTSNPYISTLIITSFLIFSSSSVNATEYDIGWWCDKTPYPQPCKYFLSQTNQTFSSSQESDFRKLEIQLAIQRAQTTYTDYVNLGSKCRNEKEKAAWTDCLDLYQQTIFHLNHTLESTVDFDTQTWLSTALTNLETCDAGFLELQVADFLLPLMSNNVSKLISNTLAVSCGASKVVPQTYKHGFPTWVTKADRKLLQSSSSAANLVVAQDGSGDYTSIQAAINAAAKRRGSGRFVIRIKSGVYREKVEIANNLENIMLDGDGLRNTFISGSRSIRGGFTTFNSATVDGETEQALTCEFPAVTGEGFIARGITFRNTAGPQNYQAVAFRSGSDLSVFYRCGFEGYQDTLYVHSQRQFYKECDIYGTVDFIFGNAAVVLQSCNIYARKPIDKQKIAITAQGRTDPNQNTGISIQNSRVMAASDLKPVLSSFKTYLGRPWKEYSRSVFLETYLDSLVDPAGWLEWDGNFALDTLYYGEYRNMGPGASTSGRVKWRGYRAITSANEASKFTVANFIAGDSWLPKTGVPFTSGL